MILKLIFFIYLFAGFNIIDITHDNKPVYTTSGPIRGQKLYTLFKNKEYLSFKGIPYAEPPIDRLRFKVNIFL